MRTTSTTPYYTKQIAYELTQTALGHAYFGNALLVAIDLPCVTNEQKECIKRWLVGKEAIKSGADTFMLQHIALDILAYDDQVTQYYRDRNNSGNASLAK